MQIKVRRISLTIFCKQFNIKRECENFQDKKYNLKEKVKKDKKNLKSIIKKCLKWIFSWVNNHLVEKEEKALFTVYISSIFTKANAKKIQEIFTIWVWNST